MSGFAVHFVCAFIGFLILAIVGGAVVVGPIVVLVELGVAPYPYGGPLYLLYWCAVGAVWYAWVRVSEGDDQ